MEPKGEELLNMGEEPCWTGEGGHEVRGRGYRNGGGDLWDGGGEGSNLVYEIRGSRVPILLPKKHEQSRPRHRRLKQMLFTSIICENNAEDCIRGKTDQIKQLLSSRNYFW